MSRFRIVTVSLALACLAAAATAHGFGGMGGGAPAGGGAPMGMGGGSAPTISNDEPVKVDKAKGADAYTVAELYEKAAKLDKKTVVVRGKVVKVSRGIMDRTWVHLRDGSGDLKAGTGRIVVTSQQDANVGDVVTAKAILAKDKDFGAGYSYTVILEEGTFTK
jgi:hypothetical protein